LWHNSSRFLRKCRNAVRLVKTGSTYSDFLGTAFEKKKSSQHWNHSGRTWKYIEEQKDSMTTLARETPSSSETASKQTTLYSLARVPVLAPKANPILPRAQVLDTILKATKATNAERPTWSVIPDTSKDGDLYTRKKRLFETLCTQFESLAERFQTAQSHLLVKHGRNEKLNKWTEVVRKMQKQISAEDDPLLLDMQCQTLSSYLLEVAKAVSSLEEDVMRDNFDTNKMVARLASVNMEK
jgi:hypothetical protein